MKQNRLRTVRRSGLGPVSIGLPILMFVALALSTSDFLSLKNISNVNSQIIALLLAALGQLLVALAGGIDLSIGSVISLVSVIVTTVDPTIAIPAVIAVGLIVGLVNGTGMAVFGVHPLIMTLASMTFVQGLALLLSGTGGNVPPTLISLVNMNVFGVPGAVLWFVAAVALISVLLYKTRFGLHLFAVGANAQSAALTGVRVRATQIACYVLCSLCGVVAGLYLTGRVASGDPQMGQSFGLDSVTAIALGGVQLTGGIGSAAGAVAGTITLGLITNGMNLLGVSPFFCTAITGILLIMAVSFQRREAIGV
ncbi:ABC transporter permease [Paraburkholderia sp. UYCP14C]|uniref:ABC transporter permease n=1 Tax=Paraburkholderia sp. UYCP14C TaxID=2511130 RepID=UPI0010205C7B|nr:ABC transporter permease [Paraburkholderia sp. UYCP14C]RZF29783.1 ABC transporter permease [Paraburkholderia sp. UYCP14C]